MNDLFLMDGIWRIPLPSGAANADDGNTYAPRSIRDIVKHWKPTSDQMCHVWTSLAPADLCARSPWDRLRRMRELSLFSKCPEGFANLQLVELFQLGWRNVRSEEDLLSQAEHLREGDEGKGCLIAPVNSLGCLACFGRIQRALEQMESIHWTFTQLLHRFDCRMAKNSGLSTTRPFSPNTTCHNCAEWYRKWLLVNLVGIWKQPPCINWCYYTQLACPHLATNKVVEFAGHPVFLCKDQRLSTEQRAMINCSCFHPCDMVQTRIVHSSPPSSPFAQAQSSAAAAVSASASASPIAPAFDFFPASVYCRRRNDICRMEEAAKRGRH